MAHQQFQRRDADDEKEAEGATPHPIAPPLRPLTMKLPNTSIRMCPAIIATNSRSPRLNGRTMKEMNSIAAISGTIGRRAVSRKRRSEDHGADTDDQHDREAQNRKHAGDAEVARRRERVQTWITASGMRPSRFATRMKLNSEKM